MAIDSTADLLFRVGANTDDGEANIKRFRMLLSKDLSDISGEFKQWAEEVFGAVTSVETALVAAGAATGALLTAAAGLAVEAGRKYSEYVDEVERGMRVTGLSAENMSKLKFAADQTHVSYESLVTGLTRFTSTVVKATQDWDAHGAAFKALGITQEQVKAGEKDLMPLLERVADRFHAMGNRILASAEARELFARGGPALVNLLSQGSEKIREMGAEAEQLGLVIGTKDVEANERYKASIHLIKAEIEAFVVTIGRDVLPVMTKALAGMMGFILGIRDALKEGNWSPINIAVHGAAEAGILQQKIEELAKSLAKFGDEAGTPLADTAEKAKEEWSGLSDILQKVRERTEEITSLDDKTAKEYGQLTFELGKVQKKFEDLKKAGKLDPKDAQEQQAALSQMNAAMAALLGHYMDEIARKNKEAGEELARETAAQQKDTFEGKLAAWDDYILKLAQKLAKEKADTSANVDALEKLWKAGYEKIGREKAEADEAAQAELDKRAAQYSARTLKQQHDALDEDMNQLWVSYSRKNELTTENEAKIAAIRAAGHAKIDADNKAAVDAEMARLGEQAARIEGEWQTAEQRVAAQYQADVAKFSTAEEKKSLTLATSEAQRAAIRAQFQAIRDDLYRKEQNELQALKNSQGWRGVFGSEFAQMIRGDADLSREWAQSLNQSHMLVRASLEGLKEAGQQTFEHLAQGMGSNIANARVYKKSIGEAMKAAAASTLESLAAESITYAIYSTALGFLRLAQHDYEGAGNAFASAAIWGSVGAAAAVAGRAIAPAQGGQAGSTGAGAGQTIPAGAGTAPGDSGAGAGQSSPHVTVNVWGHIFGVSGIQEVASALNDAVLNKDVTLTATNTKNGVRVTK